MSRRVQDENVRAGHRKLKVAPPPSSREIPCPDYVTLLGPADGAVALAEFQRLAPMLRRMGSVTAIDANVLGDYCTCFARLAAVEATLTSEGLVVEGRADTKVKNPLVAVASSYRQSLKSLAAQLAIGASSRGTMNLTAPKTPPADTDHSWLPPKKDQR
jgi:P27 family predicted phage terminase small subunit